MGYTHYWTQTRSFTEDEWKDVSADIRTILNKAIAIGVPLADAYGHKGKRPSFNAKQIMFNGVDFTKLGGDDDSHETMVICRDKQRDHSEFCKTARKPYDVVVTACLCYLSSVTGAYDVSSDGYGVDFMAGLSLAQEALPEKANILDLPMGVMQHDRWTGPWVSGWDNSGYEVHFCVNGKGYVKQNKTGAWYCFQTHLELAKFLDANKEATFRTGGTTRFAHHTFTYGRSEPDIWNAMGSFDEARHARIARSQGKVLSALFPVDVAHDEAPPAYVRPGDFTRPGEEGGPPFHYYIKEVLTAAAETV